MKRVFAFFAFFGSTKQSDATHAKAANFRDIRAKNGTDGIKGQGILL